VGLRIITNGTVHNAKILEKLAEHPQVLIWVSLDGDAQLNDYIRVGASFETIKSNMEKLAQAIPHVQLRANVTLSKLNVGAIPRILSAIEALGPHVQGFDYHFVEDSRALRITSINKAQREQIIAGLRNLRPQGRHREDAIRMIDHVIRELQTIDTYDDAEDAAFKAFNETVDALVAAGLPDTAP
jgi:sulfatase maturation enzyme AslB (radical SAM superfamily)